MTSAIAPVRVSRPLIYALLASAALLLGWIARWDQTAIGFHGHGYCYLWLPSLVAVHVAADSIIGLSYVAISLTLAYLVYRARRHIPFGWMFLAFGLFIIACGMTHFMEVLTLWMPLFWLSADVKIVTAVASIATAVALPPLVPKTLAMIARARIAGQRNLDLEETQLRLERALEQASKGEAKFRALLEAAPDAILATTGEGRIILVNSQTERLFGYLRDELIDQPVERLLPERIRVEHVEHRRKFYAAPQSRPMGLDRDLTARRKDGTEFPTEISLSPLRTDNGLFVIAVVRDITDRKRIEAERTALVREQEARLRAEESNRLKDEFLATLSHELRTPLNAMLGWTEVLQGPGIGDAMRTKGLAIIARNVHVQHQIVSDLLDISASITGKLRLTLARTDLGAAVRHASESIAPAAEAKDIRVSISGVASPLFVLADAERLQQIFWNLLSNAVKFTPRGGTVDVRTAIVNGQIEVRVTDSGIGISAVQLAHIFERFHQADNSRTRQHGGLGLGLSIVKQLAELQGGAVTVTSEGEGRGSTFVIRFPVRGRAEDVLPRRSSPSDSYSRVEPDLRRVRVLVVDDEADARDLVRAVLDRVGAVVDVVASAGEALDALAQRSYDVLLVDIGMPGEDGYALIHKVRTMSPAPIRPIRAAALTAYARSTDRVRALSAGFDQHVPKPVVPQELVAVVAALAGIRSAEG